MDECGPAVIPPVPRRMGGGIALRAERTTWSIDMRRDRLSHSGGLRFRVSIIRILAPIAAGSFLGAAPPDASGDLLYPSGFAALAPSLSESGVYTVDTDSGTMLLPDGSTIVGNGGGVFAFGSIDISGATFIVSGASPFVLLSQGNMTLDNASIGLDALGQMPGPGGSTGPAGGDGYYVGAGGGGGGGAGGQGGPFIYLGVPERTPPWGDYLPGATGGGAGIGPLVGGRAGGNSYYGPSPMGNGGAGGGAIELGARGILSLSGVSISANGGMRAATRRAGAAAATSLCLGGASMSSPATYRPGEEMGAAG